MSSTDPAKLNVFVYSFDGTGHINACVGLAQALAKRGHRIFFVASAQYKGQFEKFGFDELLLVTEKEKTQKEQEAKQSNGGSGGDNNPAKFLAEKLLKSGIFSDKSPKEKSQMLRNNSLFDLMYENSVQFNVQIKSFIEQHQPQLIVVDHFMVSPSIIHSGIPWVYLFSGNPISMYNSRDLPPFGSGYPTTDKTNWHEFDEILNNSRLKIKAYQNKLLKHFNYPELEENVMFYYSNYLNIYGYPEELDYDDIVPMPDHLLRVDAFCRELPEPFELPAEFKAKIKDGDKLIYISMGSMGSIDVELMKRLVAALANHPTYKCVVSKGPLGDQYELPDNMWGQNHLPQTNILPLVDLVITHGGNNTVTETFSFGKPMIVMPLFADQYDNAQRLLEKGYGLRMNPYKFTSDELKQNIEQLLQNQTLAQQLRKASERIRQSNSKEKACIQLEQLTMKYVNKTEQ